MRIVFFIVVLAGALFVFQLIDKGAMAAAGKIVERKVLPMDVPFEKREAGTLLNHIRQALDLTELSANGILAAAAQAHAEYLVKNRESSHYEAEGKPYFTGYAPIDRAYHAGYQASFVSENLSTHNDNAENSMDGLFAAIYHRFGFLSPNIDEVGIGVTQDPADSQNSAFVYVMANSEFNRVCTYESFRGSGSYVYGVCKDKKHRIAKKTYEKVMDFNKANNPKIILYPYKGQKEVPLTFYNESPDPLPDYDVSGFPISIEFNEYYIKNVKIDSFTLFDETEKEIAVRLLNKQSDPHQRFTAMQFALFPLQRLEYDTSYTVEITYRDGEGSKALRWQFRTRKAKEELHVIVEKDAHVVIAKGKSHLLYFKPLNAHDLIKNVKFPQSLDVQFIDNNTLKITLMDESLESFDIVSDERTLHVEVISY